MPNIPRLSLRLPVLLVLLCAASAASHRDAPTPLRVRVLLATYNPVIEAEGGKRLHQVCGWKDPEELVRGYIADVQECSGGFIQYQVVQRRLLDEFPRKLDGFRYDDASYLSCFHSGKGWHQPDAVDYGALLHTLDVPRLIQRRVVDEVWVMAMPYAGLYESTMGGRGAYFCNSPPLAAPDEGRLFVVMGFNYERGVGEMLENLGHRVESIMRRVYGSWEAEETHAWNRFTLYDRVAPGRAACGNVHFAPNSVRDYDWGNPTPVWSTADDWLNYPRLTGRRRLMTAADWGGGEIRAHHRWWLGRLPRAPGRGPDGKQANWWKYVADMNGHAESR